MAGETAPFSAVYRELVRTLKADPTLRAKVKNWQTWDGTAGDRQAFTIGHCPYVVLTPSLKQGTFWGPSDFKGVLAAEVIVGVRELDSTVSFDLLWAIVRAIYPKDDTRRAAIHAKLRAAGLEADYTVSFSGDLKPISDPDATYHETKMTILVPVLELTNP